MATGPVAFTVTVPPAPFADRKDCPTFNPLLLEIDAPLLTSIVPALTVMEPAGASLPVEVEMSPPPNIVSLGVLTVTLPALPVPNVLAETALELFTTVTDPELNECALLPEMDSCSDAVTDTLPPGPEPKVELLIVPPPVNMIVAASTFTSPAPPGPSVADAIRASFMVRIEVDTKTGPPCPKPRVALEVPLALFSRTTGPIWKIPGRNPDMVMESDAVTCKLPVAPAPYAVLPMNPPSLRVNCARIRDRSPAAPAPNV